MNTSESNTSSRTSAGAASPRFQRLRLRHAVAFGLPFLAVGGAILWFNQASAGNADAPDPPPSPTVTVAPVEERRLVDRSERIGRVVATETVELRPEVSGRVVSVGFSAGDRVHEGEVLFTIDPQPYAAVVEAARAEVAGAVARADTARREADRATRLREQQAISSEEAELRRSRAAETRAELLAARAALETAEINLERTQVRAPIDGRTSRAYVTKGNVVSGHATGGTLLTTIVSTGEAHVHVNVDEATVHRFRRAEAKGTLLRDKNGRVPVELRLDQSDAYSHLGYVESLDNRIDPQTGSLTVRLYFEDPGEELLPGSFVRVRVPVSAERPRMIVSERAIGTDQDQKYVFTVQDDETVAYRTVTLGPSLGDERIIESGLAAGERIIVDGIQQVRPGMKVTTTTQTAEAYSAGLGGKVNVN